MQSKPLQATIRSTAGWIGACVGAALAISCQSAAPDSPPDTSGGINMMGGAGTAFAPGVAGASGSVAAPGGSNGIPPVNPMAGSAGNPGVGAAGGGGGDVPMGGAGGGSPGGAGGNAAGAGAGGTVTPPPPTGNGPPCITMPATQAAIIGDSYVTGFVSPPLQPELTALVPAAASYPNYAGAGCSMASGGICTGLYGNVPDQYAAAHAAQSGLKFIIMTGGGNDALLPAAGSPDCKNLMGSSMEEGCKAIVKLSHDTAVKMLQQMATDGVRDVVFFFYPHLPSVPLGLGGTNPNELVDYSAPLFAKTCADTNTMTGGKLTCHFIDLRKPFDDSGPVSGEGPWKNIVDDGVHPSDAGQRIIAKQIADLMTSKCLGQASGCCTP